MSQRDQNLFTLLQHRFPEDRAQPVISLADGREYSYAQLEKESAKIANALVGLGVSPGDRIAVQVEKSPQALFLYLGCLRTGAVYLPLNTAYTEAELAYFIGDAEPRVLVCRPESEGSLAPLAKEAGVAATLTLDANGEGKLSAIAVDQTANFQTVARAAEDLAAICYTSGTTGRSKGAMITHRNLSSNAFALHKIWGFEPGDVLLHALPIFHVHGLFVAINTTLANGGSMIFLPKFEAKEVLSLLPRASVMMGVPTFYTRLLALPDFTAEACRHMRLFISGSAPLLAETHREFEKRTKHRILERYGMTEAGMITSNPYEGERIAGSVGFPLPEVEVRVCDESGCGLKEEEIGVLEVRGPNVFKGYWRMPEKTAEEFREDGFFITGDIAKIDARGYVHIVGRAKDLIISGGFNVYPKEIELLIDEMAGIDESAVVGLPHPDFGEAVTAVVKAKTAEHPSEEAVISTLKGKLAKFKVPKRVFFVEELPRNTMGKVQKNLLRDTFKDCYRQ